MLRIRLLHITATATIISLPAQAQAPAGWTDFTKLFQSYVDADKIVGASVVTVKAGREIGRYDTGFANKSASVRVDSQTIFHWGSITKSLTAISIMQLRDRGKLSLDDKIRLIVGLNEQNGARIANAETAYVLKMGVSLRLLEKASEKLIVQISWLTRDEMRDYNVVNTP